VLFSAFVALGACVPVQAEVGQAEVEVTRPMLVHAVSLEARQLTPTLSAEDLIIVYEVRLDVRQVLAGGDVGSMESDVVTVRLAASNAGYFRRGADLVVLLDPRRIAAAAPLHWRGFSRFACVEKAEMEGAGLDVRGERSIAVGSELCLPYGP
jgi:hypothetical protein